MIIYLVVIVLIVFLYFYKWIGKCNIIYIGVILGVLLISFFNGLESVKIKIDVIFNVL